MNNIIAFPARSGSSVEIQESQLAEREVTTVKSQCAIDFGDLLKLPLDQWATKLDDIQHQLRTLNDPRTRTLEKGVENIRTVSSEAIEALRSAAAALTGIYSAIASSRGDDHIPTQTAIHSDKLQQTLDVPKDR